MIIDIKVPELPDSVTEATIGNWNKKVGDYINQGENLVDLETDKVILDLPAPNSGVITEIIKENGSIVVSGQIIAKIDTVAQASALDTPKEEKMKEKVVDKETEKIAMPAANKIAKEQDLDLNKITGSGKDGRILKEDIISNKEKDNISSQDKKQVDQRVFSSIDIPSISLSSDRPEQRVPMSRLRQRVAQRLIQSQRENAILTTFNEVNMKPIMDLRNKYKDVFLKKHNIKLGFMSFFVKAAVTALQKFPVVNASIDNNDIIYHGYFDIGIAVSSPRGLVVPILRNVDSMSLADIEKQIANYAVKAKEGKLTLEELTGGTFSITNGGTFGSMMSTPIINPPQSAILGMHATKERAIVENGEIVIRPMMYLALSYDHRLIDGREAVLTLVTIKDMLEDPSRIILDI